MIALLLVVLASSPAPPGAECRAESAAVAEVRAVAAGIVEADNRRDLARVLASYAEDAILMPPGEPPVQGRARIRARYEALFASMTPAIEARIDEACVESGLGFVRGHNGGRLVPRGAGERRALDDGFLMLLRREAAGEWKISHLMWHRESPPGGATKR